MTGMILRELKRKSMDPEGCELIVGAKFVLSVARSYFIRGTDSGLMGPEST
jgi:hypothetical protein